MEKSKEIELIKQLLSEDTYFADFLGHDGDIQHQIELNIKNDFPFNYGLHLLKMEGIESALIRNVLTHYKTLLLTTPGIFVTEQQKVANDYTVSAINRILEKMKV